MVTRGGRGHSALWAHHNRVPTDGLLRSPRFQRPFPVIFRQAVGYGVGGQVEDDAVAAAGFGAQAPAYHLQVQGQAHGGAGDDDAGGVGQVEPFGGDDHVDQHFDAAIPETGDGLVPVFPVGVAEDDRRRDAGLVEHRRQVASVVHGHGVGNRRPLIVRGLGGVLLPEGQRAGGQYIQTVAVGLLDASLGVVAGTVNGAAGDALLRRRDEHLRQAQSRLLQCL